MKPPCPAPEMGTMSPKDMIIMQPFVTANRWLLTTFAQVRQAHHPAEAYNPLISDNKSLLVQVSYFKDAREQERSGPWPNRPQQLQLFIIISFRIVPESFSCESTTNLATNLTKVIQPSVYEPEECHTSRSFGFSQQSISLLQLSGASQLHCLHFPFQLFLCVGNLGQFSASGVFFFFFEIYTAQLVPEFLDSA